MATSTGRNISILVGPTCPTCESADLRWGAPLGALWHNQCRDCGTEYRWYQAPETEGTCPGCGAPHDEQASGEVFCEDCEPSDRAYCGTTTARGMLSEHLACVTCERGEAA
jgi:hypothetical protein